VLAGACFKSLTDKWADTTTPHGRLMLTVLGGLAEFERELIRARTGEGRKRAEGRGVKFGRPPKLTAHQRQEARQRLAAGETQADVARTYAVDPTTIGRLIHPQPSKLGYRRETGHGRTVLLLGFGFRCSLSELLDHRKSLRGAAAGTLERASEVLQDRSKGIGSERTPPRDVGQGYLLTTFPL
jgi:hypothetical protein